MEILFGILLVVLGFMFSIWAFKFGGTLSILFAVIFLLGMGAFIVALVSSVFEDRRKKRELDAMEPAERESYLENKAKEEAQKHSEMLDRAHARIYGDINLHLMCPHCHSNGFIRAIQVTRVVKNRVNSIAGKAIGLGTNSESQVTQLHCDKCSMTWDA